MLTRSVLTFIFMVFIGITPAFAMNYSEVSGTIIDPHTKKPISNVYIKQFQSLNSAFSDKNGNYRLNLMRGYPAVLILQKEGFETTQIDVSFGRQNYVIKLSPIKTYNPVVPPAHTPLTPPESTDVFGNQFTAFYQVHNGNHNFLNNSVNGFTINELGLNGHIQISNWLFKGDFFRNRFPIDVANFPFQPAFFVNSMQAKISAGQNWRISPTFNLFLGGDILYHNSSPDNRNNQDSLPVPYTGTLLDFEQHRAAVGASILAGWKLSESITILPEATLYPVGVLGLNNSSLNAFNFMYGGEIGARLKWEFAPGMSLVGQYRKQIFAGLSFFDNADYINMGLSFDPWQMASILDTIKSLKIGHSD